MKHKFSTSKDDLIFLLSLLCDNGVYLLRLTHYASLSILFGRCFDVEQQWASFLD